MAFRRLMEMCDKDIRKELGDYYIISKWRMENFLECREAGAEKIKQLTEENKVLREQLEAELKKTQQEREE